MDLGAAIDITYEWLESPSTSKDEVERGRYDYEIDNRSKAQ